MGLTHFSLQALVLMEISAETTNPTSKLFKGISMLGKQLPKRVSFWTVGESNPLYQACKVKARVATIAPTDQKSIFETNKKETNQTYGSRYWEY